MEIVGFPNYLIYPDGRVWSKNGKGRFLKPQTHTCKYYFVTLHNNNKRKTLTIHRLIAQHYIPNPNDYPCVDHINRVRTDNRIENLRWATHQMNNQNRSKMNSNTSGHSYIARSRYKWKFQKNIDDKKYIRYFYTKTEAICYKYIILLKLRVLKNT